MKHKKILLLSTFLMFFPMTAFAAVNLPENTHSAKAINYIMLIPNWVFGIALPLSIISIVYGGYRYMTSAAELKQIEEAKSILITSGLFIVLSLSYFGIMRLLTNIF